MFKYFSLKNIENYKYEISALRSENLTSKESSQVHSAEQVIAGGKTISRVYIVFEILFILTRIYSKKPNKLLKSKLTIFAWAYLRLNIVWLTSNFLVNYYLINFSSLDKIKKKKELKQELDFSQYIRH